MRFVCSLVQHTPIVAAALHLSLTVALAQQPGKDGPLTVSATDTVLNKYATLASDASAGSTTIDVSNPGGGNGLDPATLTAGDLLLVMQMQGATMDTSYRVVDFGSGNDESYAIAMQSDGKIVVVGYATGATQDFAVMRFLEDGRPDTSFDGDGWLTTPIGAANEQAIAVAIQSDGKIVVAGFADVGGGNNDFAVVRYETNGALDGTFGTGGKVTTPIGAGDDQARGVAIQTDGKIVVTGWTNNGANNDVAVVRYDANGVPDGGFGTGGIVTTPIGPGHDEGFDVAIQTDGKIVVTGDSANAGGNDDIVVLRYLTGGGLDVGGFGVGGIATTPIGAGDDSARGLALQTDGKIVVAGSTWNGTDFDFAILRYSTGGVLDGTFSAGGIRTVALGSSNELSYDVALQSDGKVVATGWAHNGSDWDYGLVRLTSSGNLDTSFDVDGKLIAAVGNDNAFGEGVAIHPDGRIFVAGPTDNSFDMDFGLVGFTADGVYSYGTVLDLGGAGNYELVSVASVAGNTITLDCAGGLLNDYTVAGNTQVVRVPQYSTLTVTGAGSVVPSQWNGQYGGVVALHVQGTATIDGTVQAARRGFRGGSIDFASADQSLDWPDLTSIYSDIGGEKGEGIAGSDSDYDSLGGRYGRGAPANGGGGGGAHNAAGGGGANANSGGRWTGQGYMDGAVLGAAAWALDPGYIANANALTTSPGGGRGGYSFSTTNVDALTVAPGNAGWGGNARRERGGLGGHPVENDPLSRLFMGGGGGAGDGNGGGVGSGGNGGGIVLLIADTVTGTGSLDARGQPGTDTTNPNEDAPGGGGGGGSIVVSTVSLGGVSLLADGGDGGNQGLPSFADEAEGGGGAGGGGFISVSGGVVTRTANGGTAGTSLSNAVTEFPTNGGTRGAPGQPNELLVGLSGGCLTLACSPQINYRSVGTDAGILHQDGLATINAGSNEVNFSAPANVPTYVGKGDEIVIGATTFYILSRVSSTRVTVQSSAVATLSSQAYTIQRAYNTFQAWETARDGNLVGENRREIAVAYDDGARGFADFATGATISGSTTDNCHYMHITVASGQRHFGVLGAGVLIDSPGGAQVFHVRDEFTRIEGLQIDGANVTNGVIFVDSEPTAPGQYAFFSHLLIANFNSASEGALQLSHDATVRNTIVYNGDRGIQVDMGATATIENVTVYNMTTFGIQSGDQGVTDVTIRNTISVGNSWSDFDLAQTISYFGYNMFQTTSSFDPVTCPGCAGNNQTPPGSLDNLFVTLSPSGSEDLHLEAGSAAIDNGLDLSSLFADDIDGEFRALGTGWEIGADESFVAGGSGCPVSNPTWYDADWGYRTAVVIDSSQVTATHTDFPVLIQLASDAALAADAQDDGDDILFTLSDGVTKLSHEIEYFDGATGELVAWVKVPFLSSGSDTTLYMYFGNALVGSQQDQYGTWTNGYEGVWHLSEASGSGAYILNSMENDHHGTPFGTSYNATGRIHGARDFQSSGTHAISLANSTPFFDGWPQFSYEFWIRPDYASDVAWEGAGETLVLEPAAFAPIWLVRIRRQNFNPAGRGEIQSDIQFAGAGTQYVIVGLRRQQWDHVLYSYNGNTLKIYVNGAVRYNDPSIVGDALTASSVPWAIGSTTGNALLGSLDEVRFASKGRYDEWVQTEYNNQSNPSAFFNLCGPTTEVELQSFEAVARDDAVELQWKTASELDNLGFHLYRSTSPRGPFERITPSLIPGLGSSPVGAEYRYVDEGVASAVAYYYELEDIETTGKRTRHGPVSATPGDVSPAPEPEPEPEPEPAPEGDDEDATDVWGNPSGNAFRIVEQRPGSMVLELRTEGFYIEELDDGTMSLSIPGFVSQTKDELPDIPVRRAWIEAMSNRNARLTSIRELDVEAIPGMRPANTTVSEVVVDVHGTVRAQQRRSRRARTQLDRLPGLFPSESARILEDGYQGSVRKLLVEMAPLRWDAGRQELRLARRLEVRIDFAGSERRQARRRPPPGSRTSLVARLAVTERGLHAVRFEDLPWSRHRAIPASELRLSRLGNPIAYHLEPDSGSFGPGSTLYFFSQGPSLNPYGNEVVYELDAGIAGTVMATTDEATGGGGASGFWQRDTFEENRYYQAALLDAPDLWLWDLVSARQTKSFSFEIRDLEHAVTEARLDVWLQGASDFLAAPDHHVRLFVNGHFVTQTSWNGKDARQISARLPDGVLHEGENQLEIENVGDTEAEYSMVMLDRFALEYPRQPTAADGTLEGAWSESGLAEALGIDSEAFVLDVTDDVPTWVVASASPARFLAEAGHRYFVAARRAVLSPEIRAAGPTTLVDTRRPPEYLVIGPRSFLDAGSPLIEHRRAQGLVTAAVATEDIYDALGFGEPRPEAIQDFIATTYHITKEPAALRYVLLLGDATYDFKNYYGLSADNQVPPLMIRTRYLWTASDPSLAAVNGDDPLPDVAIGRLPASNVEEVQAVVKKILDFESGEHDTDAPIVMVTDNPDRAGNFARDAEELAQELLTGRDVRFVHLSELGVHATHVAVTEAFDRGASVMSYSGHGGIHLWASENIFEIGDVSGLSPQSRQPILLTMNCLNGYFHFPFFDALSEALVEADGRGAIAAFSPTGLSLNEPAKQFHRALMKALLDPRYQRLGDAVMAAQQAYAETGALPELLRIYHLLGDPALALR